MSTDMLRRLTNCRLLLLFYYNSFLVDWNPPENYVFQSEKPVEIESYLGRVTYHLPPVVIRHCQVQC